MIKPTRSLGWVGRIFADSLPTHQAAATTTHRAGDGGMRHVIKNRGGGAQCQTSRSRINLIRTTVRSTLLLKRFRRGALCRFPQSIRSLWLSSTPNDNWCNHFALGSGPALRWSVCLPGRQALAVASIFPPVSRIKPDLRAICWIPGLGPSILQSMPG
jgi:hypothetical protein